MFLFYIIGVVFMWVINGCNFKKLDNIGRIHHLAKFWGGVITVIIMLSIGAYSNNLFCYLLCGK